MRPRETRKWAWCVLILSVAVGSGAQGAAAASGNPAPALGDPTIEWLDWTRGTGAGSCADGMGFAVAVAKQLGEPPGAAGKRSSHRLSVAIERQGSGASARWAAELRLIAADGSIAGTRHMERPGESCAPLIDALALMASLILAEVSGRPPGQPAAPAAGPADSPPAPGAPSSATPGAEPPPETPPPEPPAAPLEPPPPEPEPPAASPPPSAPPTPLPAPAATDGAEATTTPARPATPSLRPSRVTAGAGIATSAGLLPKLAAAAQVHLMLALGSMPTIFASGVIWRSQSTLISGSETGSTIGLWLAGAGICPIDHRWRTRAVSACAGGEVGRLHASGIGFAQPFDQNRWAADLTAGGRLRQTLDGSDFYLALDLRVVVPLLRNRIVFGDAAGAPAELFRMWPVAAIGALELGYAFD